MRQVSCTVKIRLKKKNVSERKIMTGSQRQSLKDEAQPFWIASVHDKKRIKIILL